jgi:hypothetical protein
MERKDYIMRVIHQFIDALLKIFKLREEGKYEEALKEIDGACEMYLGLNARIMDIASDTTLLSLLTIGKELDTEKCLFLARLLNEQAQIFEVKKEDSKSYWSYTRSLRLYIESLILDRELRSEDNLADVSVIVARLEGRSLSAELKSRLVVYAEKVGELQQA